MQINGHKACVAEFLSKSINKEVVEGIPFCLAGLQEEKKLPTVDNWLSTLWNTSITRSSDEARPFLSFYYDTYRALIEIAGYTGANAIVGAGIGALAGSVVPVVGTVIGAGIGAGVGAAIGWLYSE
uniref:Glycine zipper domain-containing protein n=1 Tax=Amphimedon queenslandica TaxID=400682 RepID=A0A1X7UU02_AMPQE